MKRIIAAAVLSFATALTAVAIAEPAHALTTCNSSTSKQTTAWDEAGGFYLYANVPSYGTSVECYMNVGATGLPVRVLQIALNYCYNAGLEVDGIFGTNTKDALVAVQSGAGIKPDGGYGPQTRGVLRFKAGPNPKGYYFCGRLR